jgi:chromosome segregation ATPase
MISSLASPQTSKSQSIAFMTDFGVVLRQLLQEIQDLNAENQRLAERLEDLEELQEVYHGPIPAVGDRSALKEAFARQKESLFGLPCRVFELGQDLHLLEQRFSANEENASKFNGKKTVHRIEKLKALLKSYGGSQSFKQIQDDLDLSPAQFTRLVVSLDKRSFEVKRLPGAKRGEKVLSLKVRITESLNVR